jgi:hypothetical protein
VRAVLDLGNPREYWLTFMSGNTPKQIKSQGGHKAQVVDPAQPGTAGAIAFQKLIAMFRDIENAGMALYFPAETAAELVWMGLHGLAAALINNPEFPWTKRDILIAGMIDMAVRGVVHLP